MKLVTLLSLLTVTLRTLTLSQAAPIINEIHYNNDLNTVHNEFVELHNPDSTSVDLSNWQLTGAIEFTFPSGTILPPNGYVVIAEDPATIASVFGVTALGPYTGNLNSSGELLELLDASLIEIDRVDYGVGFPWPTLAKGKGSSMELTNPNLDNDLGSSWRSSATGFSGLAETYIAIASDWNYRKGTSEASSPIHAWTANGFTQDASWLTGQAPIGRNEPAFTNTVLDDAQNSYASVFLRKEFTISGPPPSALVLKLLYDDGVIAWINGTEIFRSPSVSPGIIDFQGNDENNAGGTGTAVSSHEKDGYEEFTIGGTAALLQSGTNVLAIQLLNDTIGSSDILIDAILETPPPFTAQAPPSPGRPNSSATLSPPPNIRQVEHLPISPSSTDPVTISAKITDPDGVASVTLSYQIVTPGNYIRKSDTTFETTWIELPMTDPEADDTYTATIPATPHRHLVRYRISTLDSSGSGVRAPFTDDASPNFAYFVYNGLPAWTGANRPGFDATATFSPDLLDDLATYHLIANSTDVTNSQYAPAFENTRFLGTLVYDGIVYDHIEFKIRGEFSTYQSGKNKWRIFFNPTREFQARDNYGNKYQEPWDELTMNACASPWAAVNRGMSGLDEGLSYRTYQLLGIPSSNTNYLHFRVIDNANETSTTSQYDSDLWGLYLAIEQPDGSYLDERGLPDGNVYKIEGGGAGTPDKKHQGRNHTSDTSDWTTFTNGSATTNTEAWWRDNLDLESYFNFRIGNRTLGNVDIRDGWNHYFYHTSNPDGTPGKWIPLPWDLDMMYICLRHQGGTIRQRNALNHSSISIEFKNRCREVLDLLLDDPSPTGGQIGQLVDEFAQIVNPTGQALTWADLDRYMWNYNPRTPTSGSAQTNHKGNFHTTPYTDTRFAGAWTRTLNTPDFEGTQKYILDYMTNTDPDPSTWSENSGDQRGYGYNFVTSEAIDPAIPNTPTISYTGSPSFPTSGLKFQSSSFSDPQGNTTFAALQWRIGEINATPGQSRTYEIEENWRSEEITTFNTEIEPPAAAVKPGNTYRARVRHKDTTGRWSHWSAPIEFIASSPDVTLLQQNLVISEIMYNPPTDQNLEFIELRNIGTTTLDLTNVRFTKGIDFDFPTGTTIAPSAYLLIVKDIATFTTHYGSSLPVIGEYGQNTSASLSNSGELLKLALGTIAIHEFEYNDNAPWPTAPDGSGVALILSHTSNNSANDPLDPLGHGIASNWRQGTTISGTPGAPDPTSTFSGIATADSDKDNLNAFLEYALGLSDSSPNGSPLTITSNTSQVTLTFPKNPIADDVIYLVETSTDLDTWLPNASLTSQTANSATYLADIPVTTDQLFIRLRVELTTPLP